MRSWSHLKDITYNNFVYEVYMILDKSEIMIGLHNTNRAYTFPIKNGIIDWDKYPENSVLFSDELKEQVNELV